MTGNHCLRDHLRLRGPERAGGPGWRPRRTRRPPATSSCCPPTPCTGSAPTRSTPRPSGRCWPPRAAVRTCRYRCWSAPGRPSRAWSMAVPPVARTLIEAFWPGGLSLVVEHAPSLQWDLGDAKGTVMVRMPLHPVATRPAAAGRSDGRVQRQPQRHARPRPPRPTRTTSSATRSRSTWTAVRRRSAWPPRSWTSPETCPGCCGSARCRWTGCGTSSARSRTRRLGDATRAGEFVDTCCPRQVGYHCARWRCDRAMLIRAMSNPAS